MLYIIKRKIFVKKEKTTKWTAFQIYIHMKNI